MGLSLNVWQFFAARALMGVFAGFSSTAMALVASQVPEQRLGYALGLLSTGQLVGSLVGPVIGGVLADLTGSYRIPFYCTSAITFASVFLVWRGVHERFVRPDGAHRRRSGLRGVALMIGAAGVLPLFFVLFMAQFSTRAVQPLVTLFVQELVGMRPDLATLGGFAFSVTGLAGMIAVPLLGRHSDEIGYRRVLLICLAGATLTSLPQAFAGSYWLFARRTVRRRPVHRRHRAHRQRADRPHGVALRTRHGVRHDRIGDVPRQFVGSADRRRHRRLVRAALGVPDHRRTAAGEPGLGVPHRAGIRGPDGPLVGVLPAYGYHCAIASEARRGMAGNTGQSRRVILLALCLAGLALGGTNARAAVFSSTPSLPPLNVPFVSAGVGCFSVAALCIQPGSVTFTSATSTFDPSGQDIVANAVYTGTLTDLSHNALGPVVLTGTLKEEVLGRTFSTETGPGAPRSRRCRSRERSRAIH